MTHQYILDIVPLHEKAIYCQGPFNEAAVRVLENWPLQPSQVISIHGPSGCGKTHLATLWGTPREAFFASINDVASFRDNKELNQAQIIIIDDFENSQGKEKELFHFYNWIGERKKYLVIISSHPLSQMTYSLKDLESRFKSIPSFSIGIPSDEILLGYMSRYFESHQLMVSEATLETIFRRLDRSFGSISEFCVYLNKAALRYKRPISKILALEILEEWSRGK